MGREIRMVPPNWEHPKTTRPNHRLGRMEECYQPLYDNDFETAMQAWLDELEEWKNGKMAEEAADPKFGTGIDTTQPYRSFCEWSHCAPTPEYYRPVWKEDCTWIQMYETVSEGTPVSPAFATPEELIDYLVANGDFWDQKRRAEGNCSMECGPWKRENAERFVRGGWAPSMMVMHTAEGTEIKTARDGI